MVSSILETEYPLNYRQSDAKNLGTHLKNRHSVVLIGMKRVGISNFLRFFLYNKDVAKTYISDSNHLFIPVDLNDLVEREIFPFWMLTLKRIADSVESSNLDTETKKYIETLFLDSIQSNDLFLLIECIRKSLTKIIEANFLPTIFFIRFDRIMDTSSEQFLNNLEGLINASHYKLAYVFTTFRPLAQIKPEIFNRSTLSLGTHLIYIKPASKEDMEIISQAYIKQYRLSLSDELKKWLFELVGGYVQYLHLSLINLSELDKSRLNQLNSKEKLLSWLLKDERITLQSEELWDSLTPDEQSTLLKVNSGKTLTQNDKSLSKYIFETGIVQENGNPKIFSPIFEQFLSSVDKKPKEQTNSNSTSVELSKKEHLLFSFLKEHVDEICEREAIIEAVWPEEEALGVSDWAIDRLVARLRSKLKQQENPYEIITIKTRGFKLTPIGDGPRKA